MFTCCTHSLITRISLFPNSACYKRPTTVVGLAYNQPISQNSGKVLFTQQSLPWVSKTYKEVAVHTYSPHREEPIAVSVSTACVKATKNPKLFVVVEEEGVDCCFTTHSSLANLLYMAFELSQSGVVQPLPS